MMQGARRPQAAFTLVELMITIAVVAVVLVLAAPSFREMIEMQRLRGVNAQLVTDLQFARAEAASRQTPVVLRLGAVDGARSCYTVYACADSKFGVANCNCNCANGAGNACVANSNVQEIRTVVVASSTGVQVSKVPRDLGAAEEVRFDPRTGGAQFKYMPTDEEAIPANWVGAVDTRLIRDTDVTLRTVIAPTGRPSVCAPLTAVSGFQTACAAN